MLSVTEANKLIRDTCKPGKGEVLPVRDAGGCFLYTALRSPIHLPPFDQSAMDGFALRHEDLQKGSTIRLSGEVAAGSVFKKNVQPETAVRIFTGAPVPKGADTVLVQEQVLMQGDTLVIQGTIPECGANIRRLGSQIRKNDIGLAEGQYLNPAALGFIAAMGIQRIKVFKKPTVGVLVSGSELTGVSGKTSGGKIFESNSVMLRAALEVSGIREIQTRVIRDDISLLTKGVRALLKKTDVLILSGGISAGKYDHTREVLRRCGVREVFYKVKQKPGKPLYFGVKGTKPVFALPGNPAAALTCYYEYVYPAIRMLMGDPDPELRVQQLPLRDGFRKKPGLTHFLKAEIRENGVHIPTGQESYILNSYIGAQALAVIPEETEALQAGDLVMVHMLPGIR